MSYSCVRSLGLAMLALLTSITIRAENFQGNTFIDFNARGNASYQMEFFASAAIGGYVNASAYASFGPIYSSSWGYMGEAGAGMRFYDIHKVGTQWVASSAEVYSLRPDASGYDITFHSNVALPASGWASGSAECAGYTQQIYGSIYGYGTLANNPPAATISVPGRTSGDSVSVGTTITVYYGASDVDGNLNGIRYNIWSPSAGFFDNGGGGYATQSGTSGLLTKTVTLSSAGDWYFWTEARDTPGATASTPTYGSGFRIAAVVSSTTYCTPAYQPTYWNDWGTIQSYNNCYNYSNNRRTDTFAQPGRASGNMYSYIDATEVSDGAISDGLQPTDAWATDPDGKTKIALVIAPGYDFHWYRQDSDGKWSHKPGGTSATNLDNSGNVITNPETADRGPYSEFVGYFFTPSDCTEGQGHANIN